MKRRHFIAGSLAACSAGLIPGFSAASGHSITKIAQPWQKGFIGVMKPFNTPKLMIEGKWPEDAYGNFYRNGPALMERNGIRLHHWFDGDGMVHRFNINNKGIAHSSQFVATEKYLREDAAREFLYNSTGTIIPHVSSPRNNDTVNVANTALLPWQDELLALWEGGSAYRLNPETLTTLGVKKWSTELSHTPFSAHPLIEKDGSLWNFGFTPYGKQARLLIYHISSNSQVLNIGNIILSQRGYLHSFAQTTDYLIFYISACIYQQGDTFLGSFKWQPELGSKLLVVAKKNINKPRWFDVPAGFVFHFANAWQDNKSIYLVMAVHKDASLMLKGMYHLIEGIHPELDHASMTYVKINLHTGNVLIQSSEINIEFPNFDPSAKGATIIYGTHASSPARKFLGDSLAAIHPDKGLLQRYCLGEEVVVEEPLLIISKKGNRYLIASYYDYSKQHSGIALFNALNLSDGPIAQAAMSYILPLGFHGCFVAAT